MDRSLAGRWLVIGVLGMWAGACSADDPGGENMNAQGTGGIDGSTGGSASGGLGIGGLGTGGMGTGGAIPVGTGGDGIGGASIGGSATGGTETGGMGTGGAETGGMGTGGAETGGVGAGGLATGGAGTGATGSGGEGVGGDGAGGTGTGGDGAGGAGTGGDGAGGTAGGNTGGMGGIVDPFEATVVPTVAAGLYTWSFVDGNSDTIVLEVDANLGARVVTFSVNGADVLVDGGDPLATGSVFWPAPQTLFDWPPPPAHDSEPYVATPNGNIVEMVGSNDPTLGVSITKSYSVNAASGAVTIEYGIVNNGSSAVSMAPWEVSRIKAGGLTFYPSGNPVTWTNPTWFDAVPLTAQSGADWFLYDSSAIANDSKIGTDGTEGWAAHIDCGAGLERSCTGGAIPLFIKQFPDIATSDFAPAEAEQELFANAAHTYVEFEQQGSYDSIPAGGTLSYTMHWYLRNLPATITPAVGSTELLDYVRGQLAVP